MRGQSVTLWLLVVVLSLAAAYDGDSDSDSEEWEVLLPAGTPTTTTGRPRTTTTTRPTTTSTTDDGDSDSESEEWEVLLPAGTPTTTTERPQTTPKSITTTSTTTPKATTRSSTTPKTTGSRTTTRPTPSSTTTTPRTTTTARAPAELAAGYEYYEAAEGSLKLHPAAEWREARLTCLREDAELASPETAGLLAAMSAALLASAQAPEEVYTGINDLYSKGLFSSLRGTPLWDMSLRWAAGADTPPAPAPETCVALRRGGDVSARACRGAAAARPFLCYRHRPAGPETECGTNPDYLFSKETSSCYKVHRSPASWAAAYASCRREGAHLLVLSGRGEALHVRAVAGKQAPAIDTMHVGATRWEDGVWMTVHGETLKQAGFDKWIRSEDKAGAGAAAAAEAGACAALHLPAVALRRRACSDQLPYVCEKKAYL